MRHDSLAHEPEQLRQAARCGATTRPGRLPVVRISAWSLAGPATPRGGPKKNPDRRSLAM
jgi:hypothetical protein